MDERAGWHPAEDPVTAAARTDLALEAHRLLSAALGRLPGVQVQEDETDGVYRSRVQIEDPSSAALLGKPLGRYVTLEAKSLRQRDEDLYERLARLLADEVRRLLPEGNPAVFVVGLGNWQATPDALGPKVVRHLLVTRHLADYVPENLRGGLGNLAALAPGVLGLTGLETGEVVEGVVGRIRPDVVIAVDALAARSVSRILTTIQLADSGLNPGAGVGHSRRALNRDSIGIPVIAVGVPTVVHAFTIAQDTVDLILQRLGSPTLAGHLSKMSGTERQRLIEEVLSPYVGDLMVTPKEVDLAVDDLAHIIAAAINAAVHPRIYERQTLL